MKEEQKPKNSSMTQNLEEMKEHGEVMEKMDTNKQVKQKGMEPDPKQD
ncbi:hypothetical protein J2S09_004732 [Bacillus fengqiuensis]|nr:hypothetical protein [Bacillus fengqiuensis]